MCGTKKKIWLKIWLKKKSAMLLKKKKIATSLMRSQFSLTIFSLLSIPGKVLSTTGDHSRSSLLFVWGTKKKKSGSKSMKEVQSLFANIIDIWRECAKHEKPLLSACRASVQHHTEGAAGGKPHTGAAMRGNRLTEVQPCPGFSSVSQLPACVVCSQSRLTRRRRRRLAVYMCWCLQVDLRGLREWHERRRLTEYKWTEIRRCRWRAHARDVRQISCKIAKSSKGRKCTENEPNCCTGKVKLDES